MCTANGSDALAGQVSTLTSTLAAGLAPAARCRVLRGGCYGLCEIGPNIVVRRHTDELPDPEVDRLSLTEADNETVYSTMATDDVEKVLRSHLEADRSVLELTRDAREHALPPQSPVAEKMRLLREKRRVRT